MDFSEPDAAPEQLLNLAIWHSVKGFDTTLPASRKRLAPTPTRGGNKTDDRPIGEHPLCKYAKPCYFVTLFRGHRSPPLFGPGLLGFGCWRVGPDLPVSMANTQHPEPKTSTMRHQIRIGTQTSWLWLRWSCTSKTRVLLQLHSG